MKRDKEGGSCCSLRPLMYILFILPELFTISSAVWQIPWTLSSLLYHHLRDLNKNGVYRVWTTLFLDPSVFTTICVYPFFGFLVLSLSDRSVFCKSVMKEIEVSLWCLFWCISIGVGGVPSFMVHPSNLKIVVPTLLHGVVETSPSVSSGSSLGPKGRDGQSLFRGRNNVTVTSSIVLRYEGEMEHHYSMERERSSLTTVSFEVQLNPESGNGSLSFQWRSHHNHFCYILDLETGYRSLFFLVERITIIFTKSFLLSSWKVVNHIRFSKVWIMFFVLDIYFF